MTAIRSESMPIASYAYRALRGDGEVIRGSVDARSLDDARAALNSDGLLLFDIRANAARERRAPLSVADLALGLRMLADLLEAGLSVRRAVGAFATVAPNAWRPAIPHLEQLLREGRSLATSLSEAPIAIPSLVVGIIAAGEAGQGLAVAMRRAAELAEATATRRAAIRSALAYPIVLAAAGAAAISLMVGVVLPRFAAVLADFDQTLPWSTRLLLQAATVARHAMLPLILAVLALTVALRAVIATQSGRRRWHAVLLRLPLVGDVRFAMAAARAALTLSALLDAGVTIRRSIGFAARASGDAEVEARLLEAGERIAAGEPAARAFAATAALTPVAVRLASAGEQSGRFTSMLVHAAAIEHTRADRVVHTSVRLLEPALVLLFAGVIAAVATALLQAVYSVRPT